MSMAIPSSSLLAYDNNKKMNNNNTFNECNNENNKDVEEGESTIRSHPGNKNSTDNHHHHYHHDEGAFEEGHHHHQQQQQQQQQQESLRRNRLSQEKQQGNEHENYQYESYGGSYWRMMTTSNQHGGDLLGTVHRDNNSNNNSNTGSNNSNNDNYNIMMENNDNYEGEGEYKQRYGYCCIGISIIQTLILIIMMYKCGIAPLYINPMIGPYPEDLSNWGGKNTERMTNNHNHNEYYRYVTPIFLHAGVLHLFGNICVQIELGTIFEKQWGYIIWMIVYICSGIGGTILSVLYMPDAISVGSSGAIMGLFGAKLLEVTVRYFERSITVQQRIQRQIRNEQCHAVLCSVIIILVFSFIPFVDWAAHVGGLITGMVVGFIIFCFFWK